MPIVLGKLPERRRFWFNSRFPNEPNDPLGGKWTMMFNCDVAPKDQGSPSLGTAYFAVDDAPDDWLAPGVVFEIYGGNVKIADVHVEN
jgi:hypothetical protein